MTRRGKKHNHIICTSGHAARSAGASRRWLLCLAAALAYWVPQDVLGQSSAGRPEPRVQAPGPSQPASLAPVKAGKLDPMPACAQNVPPSVSFTWQQVPGTLLVHFTAAVIDPDCDPVTLSWKFGDGRNPAEGAVVEHEYPGGGQFTATVRATDPCGGSEEFSATVNVQPLAFAARLRAYEMVKKDMEGERHLDELGLGSEQVEFGLKIMFDATSSNGFYFYYEFGDGTYNDDMMNPVAWHQYPGVGPYTVTLWVWDESGSLTDGVSRTVQMAPAMRFLAVTPYSGADFYPMRNCVDGSNVWALGGNCRLGVSTISDPNHPGVVRLMTTNYSLSGVSSLAVRGGLLYIANGDYGVTIYRADPDNFACVGRVLTSELGGAIAKQVAVVGSALYVSCGASGVIHVFDLAAHPAAPEHQTSLATGGYLWGISSSSPDFLVARVHLSLAVVDTVDPLHPVLSPSNVYPLSNPSQAAFSSSDLAAAALTSNQTQLVSAVASGQGSQRVLQTALGGAIPRGSSELVLSGNRAYLIPSGGGVVKYDVSDSDGTYQMGFAVFADDWVAAPVVVDPDGAGPANSFVVIGASPYGFATFTR